MPLEITLYNKDGEIVEHYTGPTDEQLWEAHKLGYCEWTCGYCYDEATSDDHYMLDGFCTRCGLNTVNAEIRSCTEAEREIWRNVQDFVSGGQQ